MEKTTTYNGWTNYETWACKLWIDNDRGSVEYWQDRASNWLAISQADKLFTKEENAINDLRQELQEECENTSPLTDSGFYTDLLNAAIREINWHEIATALIEEVK